MATAVIYNGDHIGYQSPFSRDHDMTSVSQRVPIKNTPQYNKPSLVVIDDDPVFRQQIKLMAGPGYTVYEFGGPLEIDEGTLLHAEYMVLDLSMPDIDGLTFIKALANLNRHTKLLIVSGHDQHVIELAQQTAQLFGIPVAGVLHKPVTSAQFHTAIDDLNRLAEMSIPAKGLQKIINKQSLDVETGMAAGEFTAYYQPQIDLKTARVIGLEALARWNHPLHGLLSPGSFIDSIESTSLSREFTLLMLEFAIADYMQSVQYLDPQITVSVNVPPEALKTEDFADQVILLLKRYKCPAHQLVCEITERGTEELNANASYAIARLRMAGIQMSIDDFGTGQSGLNKLKTHAYNEIKIDRCFIRDLSSSQDSLEIVKSIINLSHQIDLRVVAEGVETKDTLTLLKQLGCDVAQGFLLAHPMTIVKFVNWYDDHKLTDYLNYKTSR